MITETDGIFFVTITCYKWISLLQITDTYDAVYEWFDYLKKNGHFIIGYVIMPNHIHALCVPAESPVSQPSLPQGTRRTE
jgi:REP element-mobilizing transposase RayT